MTVIARKVVSRLLAVVAMVALPAIGSAQDATVSGTVTDATGRVMPAVTITTTRLASGEKVTALTDSAGAYRIPLRTGAYQIDFAAVGFATVQRTGVDLLLGQQGVKRRP